MYDFNEQMKKQIKIKQIIFRFYVVDVFDKGDKLVFLIIKMKFQ